MLHKLKQRFADVKTDGENLKIENLPSENFQPPKIFTACESCNGASWWKAFRDDTWRCLKCQPPPNRAIIELVCIGGTVRPPSQDRSEALKAKLRDEFPDLDGKESGGGAGGVSEAISTPGSHSADAKLIESYMLNAFVPVCENCHSQIYIERHWSDGAVDMSCWSCKRPTDGKSRPELIKVRESKDKPESEGE